MTAEPKRIDFVKLEPGRGYWVKAKEGFSLIPKLLLSLEGDIDVPPLSVASRPFPQPEDEDLNGDGFYDTPQTQDSISFRNTQTMQYLTIVNQGDGTLNWEIKEDIHWLSLDYTQGITTTETDFVGAKVQRDGMLPGEYRGTLSLIAGDQTKVVHVKMIVSDLDGDYEGRAVIHQVNGRPASIASVDLSLSLFKDSEGFLRGIIDADKTLLFPFDVFLSGCYYETGTNHFILSSSFLLPQGPDINNPPFDIYPDPNDIDINKNGIEDIINPFPFDITREITLIGDRVSEGCLEGAYFEILRGALPEPITMEGRFLFHRTGFTPSKKTPFNYTFSEDTLIENLSTFKTSVSVNEPILIDGIEVSINIQHASLSQLTITLISPSGMEVILHDQTSGENLNTTYPSKTIPAQSLEDYTGGIAKGEWSLWIEDKGDNINGWLKEWSLHIYGLPVYKIYGKVYDAQTKSVLLDATLMVTGAPVVQSAKTNETGDYTFSLLSSGSYLLSITKPGYKPCNETLWVERSDQTRDIALNPEDITNASIKAAPIIGNVSQEIILIALFPLNMIQRGDVCLWDFGDGSTETTIIANTSVTAIKHVYIDAGAYSVSA